MATAQATYWIGVGKHHDRLHTNPNCSSGKLVRVDATSIEAIEALRGKSGCTMCNRAPAIRMPIGPVIQVVRTIALEARVDSPAQVIADLAGVSRRTVYRWDGAGGIPFPTAEQIARTINRNPHEVWPVDYDNAVRVDADIRETTEARVANRNHNTAPEEVAA